MSPAPTDTPGRQPMRLAGLVCATAVMVAACGGDRDVDGRVADADARVANGNVEERADLTDRDVSINATAPQTGGARATGQLRADGVSTRQAQASPRSRDSVESRLLQDGALMSDTFGIINNGQAWTDAVRAFENDGLTDPDARDLHQLFGDWLRTSLGRHGLEISGFGCGRSLCAATIPLAVPGADERYAGWYETDANEPPMPLPVFAQMAFTWPGGASEMRILFSTDPDVAMVNAP
ncbi:hypothetical protein V3391_16235 [Luteimonas sp. SMYT11W]|uniref:Lipoprotein n=1 Tax=Luteimonas flava TaxID=3115822 RepID=A0ABU7WJ65_9GAMM